MTIFELLTVVVCVVATLLCGSWLGSLFGTTGWMVGACLGLGVFVIAYALFRYWLRKH